jgi:hypothetical protein
MQKISVLFENRSRLSSSNAAPCGFNSITQEFIKYDSYIKFSGCTLQIISRFHSRVQSNHASVTLNHQIYPLNKRQVTLFSMCKLTIMLYSVEKHENT